MLVLSLAGSVSAFADTGFLDRSVVVAGATHRYQVFVPANFTADRLWPVLIDLHGNGAQGSDGIRQTAHFLADTIRMTRGNLPFVVVFPQAAIGTTWQTPAMKALVMNELDNSVAEFNGDPNRIYLSGFSMGGNGAYRIAADAPARFAAVVVVAGFVDTRVDDPRPFADLAARLRSIPIWIFQGEADARVPAVQSRRMVEALKAAGAGVRYTEYPNGDHGGAADTAYADPELFRWLMEHSRANAK
jgi:predicted peptidase